MTLASDIQNDLANMLGDWGDSIRISATDYNGVYDSQLVETDDYLGFAPTFSLSQTDVTASGVARGDSVTITSGIAGLTAKTHTVRAIEAAQDGLVKLILSE
jgi:hypothetical protein